MREPLIPEYCKNVCEGILPVNAFNEMRYNTMLLNKKLFKESIDHYHERKLACLQCIHCPTHIVSRTSKSKAF